MARLRPWILVALWAGLISGASTDALSSAHTSRIILPLLHWLLPHAAESTLESIHYLIRKSGHFFEYFVFSLLLVRAIRLPRSGWKLRWALLALLIAAAYSGLDEWHQSFVPSRGASPWDCLLDTTAATTAQVAVWGDAKRRGWSERARGISRPH
jgi:VanZ family protein